MKKQLLVLMLACGACFVSTTEARHVRWKPFSPPTHDPKVSDRGPKFLEGLEEELSPAFEAGEAVNPTPYLMAIIQTLQATQRAVGMKDDTAGTDYNLRVFRKYNKAAQSGRMGMEEFKKEFEEKEAAMRKLGEKMKAERERAGEERRRRVSEEHRKYKSQ